MAASKSRCKPRPATALAVIFVLLLLGVYGTGAPAGGGATASKVARVDVVSFAFKPATLRIAKGSSITFSNSSRTTHTATRDGSFDTGSIKPGKSATVRFKRKGFFPYHCLIHPSMRGKIIVD